MVWLHPELLEEVDVVVGLTQLVGDRRHPLLLVLAAELARHTPRVERHHPGGTSGCS